MTRSPTSMEIRAAFSVDDIIVNISDQLASTNETTTNDGARQMSSLVQAIAIVLYSAVCVLALGGNSIVCYIVLSYQRMRTVTNYFIVNLACSDILMAMLCIPLTFVVNVLTQYWPFVSPLCPIVMYAQVVAVFLNAFTLVAISLDRYVAIIYPLRPRMTNNCAIAVIAVIWLLSLSVSLPVALLSRLVPREDLHGVVRQHCNEIWPYPDQRYAYSMSVMALQYFVPLFGLMFTYARIGFVIWGTKIPGEAQNGRDQRLAASKRKMVKMMIAVVVIYAACWLPLHMITIVGDSYDSIWEYRYIQPLWTACHWLAMSNCCYNPLVYCWMNTRFRDGFRHVLRWLPCIEARADSQFLKRPRIPTYLTTTMTTAAPRSERRARGSFSDNTPDGAHDNNFNNDHCRLRGHDDDSDDHRSRDKVALRPLKNGRI